MSKGMLVFLLVPALGNCSNGGVSTKHKQFVLTGEGMPEIFEPTEETPELVLVKWYGFYKAVPAIQPRGVCGPMSGGCYVETSDGRFSRVTGGHPVPLHDRFETEEFNKHFD